MNHALIYCTTSYFTCGVLVASDNTVVEAVPIVKWAVGKHFRELRDFLYKKGGQWQKV